MAVKECATMKRVISLILALLLVAVCTACGGAKVQTESVPSQEPEPTVEPEPLPEPKAEEPAPEPKNGSKVLVICSSATGTTLGVAEKIASLTDTDLIEIIPAQPYTAEDLNYNDSSTRATVEQNTPDARPEIANEISLDGCTTVYLGYPIWWGQAPRIMSTFVESHDFTGITIIPFCTSGSSDIGQSDDTLAEQAGTGHWLQGKRFSGDVSNEDLLAWIDSTQ